MSCNTKRQIGFLVLLLTLASINAHADSGLPMLVVVWPLSWLLLLPVIALEAVIARRILKNSWRQSLKLSGDANIISSFIGIPIVWFVLTLAFIMMDGVAKTLPEYIASFITMISYTVWLPPSDEFTDSVITVIVAALYIPFYFASVWIEALVGWKLFPNTDKPLIKRWSVVANFWSYAITILALLIWSVLV